MENENAALNQGEPVSPLTIGEMDDEAFDRYIESAKNSDGEVQTGDNSGTAGPADDSALSEPYMSFQTKEELQDYQDRTIGKRLKEIRESGEREKVRLAGLFELAKSLYGTDSDTEAVSRLEEELKTRNVRKTGMTDGEVALMRDFGAVSSEINYQKQVENIQNEWIRQGEALKKIVPDFELESAFENPEFYKSVVEEHKTIAEAYPLLQKKPPRRAISEIGSLSNGVAGHIRHDVKSMSDQEFDEYIKKIKNS